MTIAALIKKYKDQLDYIDIELLLAHSLCKAREFVLMHPEYKLSDSELQKILKQIKRRLNHEPIAYILGHKEFYGLDFLVNEHTLIPRPETELIVDQVLNMLRNELRNTFIVDVGTGSGNIITSIARNNDNVTRCYAVDISEGALKIAKKNAKNNAVDKKIKFLHGNLLEPLLKIKPVFANESLLIITANLPYLSQDIYESSADNVKKFEPKSALYSSEAGLQHYHQLLDQLKDILAISSHPLITIFLEISPEQKQAITKLIKSIFPKAKISFQKDLAGKWRICKVIISK